jgi:hypothetical protein
LKIPISLALVAALLAAAFVVVQPSESEDRGDWVRRSSVPHERAFDPDDLSPVNRLDPSFDFEQAFNAVDVDRATLPAALGETTPVALEDLYLETWHGGKQEAEDLMDAVRDCDGRAAIRFGPVRHVSRRQLDPPAAWPLELRYRADDPRAKEAAELLRDHLRTGCEPRARETVMRLVSRRGLVLRAVPALDARDAGHRIPLVLVYGVLEL